jgi:hypothetical protein
MSALPPKADIRPRDQDVCFGPTADILPSRFLDAEEIPIEAKKRRIALLGRRKVGEPAI